MPALDPKIYPFDVLIPSSRTIQKKVTAQRKSSGEEARKSLLVAREVVRKHAKAYLLGAIPPVTIRPTWPSALFPGEMKRELEGSGDEQGMVLFRCLMHRGKIICRLYNSMFAS